MDPRPGALSDHQINPVILHRRVQNFLDRGNQAVNFIEEENFTLLERSEDRGQVALAFQQRAGTGLDHDAQLAGDYLRERRLAQAGRAVQQHVVERFAAAARRLDGDFDVFLHTRLADVIGEALRADACVNPSVFIERRAGHDAWQRFLHPRLASRTRTHLVTSPAPAAVATLVPATIIVPRARPSAPARSTAVTWRAAMPQTIPARHSCRRVRQPAPRRVAHSRD